MRRILGCCSLLLLGSVAVAQQRLTLDPTVQLAVCQQQRADFIADSERAQTFMRQLAAQAADLQKKLAEAEAKIAELQK